jgi:glycosyltransferase involved in cell wall biosynthesis
MPRVSIITPHFRRPDLLRETAASLFSSTETDWEWIIVDDASPDDDWESIQEHAADPRISLFRRESGIKGPSSCRNLGLAKARGEFVLFLDSDDCLAPWTLAKRLEQAARHPNADLWVYPALLFHQQPGDTAHLWNSMGGDSLKRLLQSDNPWCVSSPLWRTSVLRTLGGFNETVFYGDDSDLHIRALIGHFRAIEFPEEMPDLFIRRSTEERITNSLSDFLLDSRLTRLTEGSAALRRGNASLEAAQIWEAQYFVEMEFLVFHIAENRDRIRRLRLLWKKEHSPGLGRRLAVFFYVTVAIACRRRAYFVLRIARRLAMILLPTEFFPNPSGHQSTNLKPGQLAELRSKLGSQSKVTSPDLP